MTNRIKLGCLADYEQFTAGSTALLLPPQFNHRKPIDRPVTHSMLNAQQSGRIVMIRMTIFLLLQNKSAEKYLGSNFLYIL